MKKNKRQLSPAEQKLWGEVTKNVAAYRAAQFDFESLLQDDKAHPITPSIKRAPIKPASPKPLSPSKTRPAAKQAPTQLTASAHQNRSLHAQAPRSVFVDGDPKTEKHIRRGRMEIDAVLDLHGSTQTAAYDRLTRFVTLARHQHARCLLVITGKGPAGGPARDFTPFSMDTMRAPRGILRMRFLEWVEQEPLRSQITRVAPAKPNDGGNGAFYIILKKPA